MPPKIQTKAIKDMARALTIHLPFSTKEHVSWVIA